MHLTRQQVTTKLPIPRKGTKYIARASSHISQSVSVLLAIRDMLKLAKTAKEARRMVQEKLLKINGKTIMDVHESIKLFNIFEADKTYRLSLLPTKKFTLEEVSAKDAKEHRLVKVTDKRLIQGGKIQLNLHDGSNVLTTEKVKVNDSLYLDAEGKVKKHISPEKGKTAMVIEGKHTGKQGTIESISGSICHLKVNKEVLVVQLYQLIVQ
ncbi:MAG: KOW motif-containing protein [Nanoarchaeota archaeon]